jgi:hypothetical protein
MTRKTKPASKAACNAPEPARSDETEAESGHQGEPK